METKSKSLYILRHAKSSWDSHVASDFERPLNERGRRDAPRIAREFANRVQRIDQILCSASQRTRDTASYFLNAYATASRPAITYSKTLYGAPPETLSEEVASAPDSTDSILVIAHNPGLTQWANALHTPLALPNLPTCGLIGLRLHATTWSAILSRVESELLFYFTPKSLA